MNPLAKLFSITALLGCSASLMAQTPINGAGASFPYPLYSKWMAEYQKKNSKVLINYQSIGSGGGIRQILQGTVDFGATDAPMTAPEVAKAQSTLHHIPTTMGSVVVTFNIPGVNDLKFTPEVLSGIYMGTINKWNDAKIAALNGGVKLPDTNITVAYRSDGSGTTSVFTEYLSKVSGEWKSKVGEGKSVKFPVGLGGKGNEGVTGLVKSTPGAVGYVELAYARQNGLAVAAIRNQKGNFIKPSPEGVSAAASSVQIPENLCMSITNGPGAKDYPISSLTYILVYEDQKDAVKGKAMADFLWWATHDGQKFASALDYAPLPKELVKKIEGKLKTLKSNGKSLL